MDVYLVIELFLENHCGRTLSGDKETLDVMASASWDFTLTVAWEVWLLHLLRYSLKIQAAPWKTMALGNTFPSPLDTFTLNKSPLRIPSCLPHTVPLFFAFPSPFTWWSAISKHRNGIWMASHRHQRKKQKEEQNPGRNDMEKYLTYSFLSIFKFQFTAFFPVLPSFSLCSVSQDTLFAF